MLNPAPGSFTLRVVLPDVPQMGEEAFAVGAAGAGFTVAVTCVRVVDTHPVDVNLAST